MRWQVLRVAGPLKLVAQAPSTGPVPLAAAHAAEGLQKLLAAPAPGRCPTWRWSRRGHRDRGGPPVPRRRGRTASSARGPCRGRGRWPPRTPRAPTAKRWGHPHRRGRTGRAAGRGRSRRTYGLPWPSLLRTPCTLLRMPYA
ncbi:DUF6245 family protein [Nonomuraea sp. NPDC049758]|uniref:DUF6245 family protein n=1 Tax=Nonomuraea sp. NPDC049758 TaxID=3154360 RepID=UPI003417667E